MKSRLTALRNRKTVPTKDQEILNKCDTSFDAWSLGVFCERQRSLLISEPTGRANTELSFSERRDFQSEDYNTMMTGLWR